jgi:hypothetical protein
MSRIGSRRGFYTTAWVLSCLKDAASGDVGQKMIAVVRPRSTSVSWHKMPIVSVSVAKCPTHRPRREFCSSEIILSRRCLQLIDHHHLIPHLLTVVWDFSALSEVAESAEILCLSILSKPTYDAPTSTACSRRHSQAKYTTFNFLSFWFGSYHKLFVCIQDRSRFQLSRDRLYLCPLLVSFTGSIVAGHRTSVVIMKMGEIVDALTHSRYFRPFRFFWNSDFLLLCSIKMIHTCHFGSQNMTEQPFDASAIKRRFLSESINNPKNFVQNPWKYVHLLLLYWKLRCHRRLFEMPSGNTWGDLRWELRVRINELAYGYTWYIIPLAILGRTFPRKLFLVALNAGTVMRRNVFCIFWPE